MAMFVKRWGPDGRGVWQARIRKRGYPHQTRTFDLKAHAVAWARQIEHEIERGTFVPHRDTEGTTLAEILRRYVSEVTPAKKGRVQEQSRIAGLLNDPISSLSLAALDGAVVAEYRDRRLESVGPKTIRNDLALLRHVLRVADREWRLFLPRGNPVDSVRKPPAPHGRDRRLLPGEETRLLAACRVYGGPIEPIEPIVMIALATAMRRGEIASMRWEHLDRPARVLLVPETKTGEPRRVPLSSRALAVFDVLAGKTEGSVWGIRADSISQAFGRVVKQARADYEAECAAAGERPDSRMFTDLWFHDLRHEATSRLFERGLNPMEVSAITGHKTLQMLKRYTHLRAEDLVDRLG